MDTSNSKRHRQKRSGGGSGDPSMRSPRPSAQTSTSTLTASSSSDYPHSVSSDSGPPGTPLSSRRSGGWDRQVQYPVVAPRSVDIANSCFADDGPDFDARYYWASSDTEDSADDAVPAASIKALERSNSKAGGSRPKRFFRSLVKKFGKSYNRYGALPNSQQEQDRNVIQHQIILEILDGRLFLAPLSRPKRVLDVGTGPGIWALEFAQRHSSCSVLGIDLDPVRPPYTVPNCKFRTMDATHDWDFDVKFDLIHVRMLADMPDKERLLRSIYDNLNPGGWVEVTEWIADVQSPNHSLKGTAFRKWNDLLEKGLNNLGSTLYYPYSYKPLMSKVGFDKIIETKNGAPTNACYPGKKLQRIGNMMTSNWKAVLEPLSLPIFTNVLGWTPGQVKSLLTDVRKEIGDTRYHSFMTLVTFCARKPTDGSPSISSTSGSASASVSSFPASGSGPPAGPPPGPPAPLIPDR